VSGSGALFIRFATPVKELRPLADELKALTWVHEAEHAVLELQDGRWAVVRGSKMEIDLMQTVPNDPFGRPFPSIWVKIGSEDQRVKRLVLHTHPQVTGPSDADLRVLSLLGQSESVLFELSGEPNGTTIRPKSGKDAPNES